MLLWKGKNLPSPGLELVLQGKPFLQVLSVFAPTLKKKKVDRLKEIYDALYYVADLDGSVPKLLAQKALTYQPELSMCC